MNFATVKFATSTNYLEKVTGVAILIHISPNSKKTGSIEIRHAFSIPHTSWPILTIGLLNEVSTLLLNHTLHGISIFVSSRAERFQFESVFFHPTNESSVSLQNPKFCKKLEFVRFRVKIRHNIEAKKLARITAGHKPSPIEEETLYFGYTLDEVIQMEANQNDTNISTTFFDE